MVASAEIFEGARSEFFPLNARLLAEDMNYNGF